MKNGQGALEFLVAYGWGVLIMVIVGGALYVLGEFSPTEVESNNITITRGEYFSRNFVSCIGIKEYQVNKTCREIPLPEPTFDGFLVPINSTICNWDIEKRVEELWGETSKEPFTDENIISFEKRCFEDMKGQRLEVVFDE